LPPLVVRGPDERLWAHEAAGHRSTKTLRLTGESPADLVPYPLTTRTRGRSERRLFVAVCLGAIAPVEHLGR